MTIPFAYSTAGYGVVFNMPGYGHVVVGAKGEGGMELFHRRSRQKIADQIQEKMKAMDIPTLMEKTQERLEEQVSFVKERLQARYGLGDEAKAMESDGSPEAHGQRMAAFAISLFDHFLEASKS